MAGFASEHCMWVKLFCRFLNWWTFSVQASDPSPIALVCTSTKACWDGAFFYSNGSNSAPSSLPIVGISGLSSLEQKWRYWAFSFGLWFVSLCVSEKFCPGRNTFSHHVGSRRRTEGSKAVCHPERTGGSELTRFLGFNVFSVQSVTRLSLLPIKSLFRFLTETALELAELLWKCGMLGEKRAKVKVANSKIAHCNLPSCLHLPHQGNDEVRLFQPLVFQISLWQAKRWIMLQSRSSVVVQRQDQDRQWWKVILGVSTEWRKYLQVWVQSNLS